MFSVKTQSLLIHLFILITFSCHALTLSDNSRNKTDSNLNHSISRRSLQESTKYCDASTSENPLLTRYFNSMKAIYGDIAKETCLPVHQSCGWPKSEKSGKLPLFVLSVGLEGAGHHLWTEIFQQPVFDCVWTNARHYQRDIADGVPRTTVDMLRTGFQEQFKGRKDTGQPPCKRIYDAEDSFPTGAIRKSGRVFMRPDLINLQQLDGVLFDIKYLIIIRNTTDTALSALRRNFFSQVDLELRTVEHTLSYLEAAMRAIPCHKTFIAHYEHALADPQAFIEPLSLFLELDKTSKETIKKRLTKNGKAPSRKAHKLSQYAECKGGGKEISEQQCYEKISSLLEDFFQARDFMWPTFAGNGFDYEVKQGNKKR